MPPVARRSRPVERRVVPRPRRVKLSVSLRTNLMACNLTPIYSHQPTCCGYARAPRQTLQPTGPMPALLPMGLCGATMGLALCRMEYTNWYTAWWCIPPAVRHVAPPPGRHRRATDPISMYTGARLYRVTAYTSHLYTQLRTKAPLFVGRQYALSMTVHHACLHEHRVSTLRATLCMHPAELHSVFVSFLSPCFGCRRRCPAQ